MLRKLLKYDMQSIWKLFLFFAASILVMSLLGGLAVRFLSTNENDALFLMEMIAGLFLFLNVMAIAAFAVIIEIMVYYRFYKNLFTDEGYLTFTLPISRAKILASKTINACIWTVATMLTIFLAVLEIFLIVDPNSLRELLRIPPEVAPWLILYVPLTLFAGLMLIGCTIGVIQFCITTGAVVAKKYKIVVAIGIYYLFSMVSSSVMQILGMVGSIALEGAIDSLSANITGTEGYLLGAVIILAVGAIAACIAFTLHFLTLGHIERRLNLS